jgi:hypothetical protein
VKTAEGHEYILFAPHLLFIQHSSSTLASRLTLNALRTCLTRCIHEMVGEELNNKKILLGTKSET